MSDSRNSSLAGQATELKDLVVAYAKQETLEPIKGLRRYVAYGLAGSILLGFGLCLGVLALLRALQTETGDTFQGNWSWAPYAITAGACLVFVGIAIAAATRGGKD